MTETREERKERQEEIQMAMPTLCPRCGSKQLRTFVTDWFAHSLDNCDLHNTGVLAEHQCEACATSFWL
jgi:hypothetical protein